MSETILSQLDQLIAERTVLNHPFYQAWSEGRLTKDELATYAKLYYPHVEAFPAYLQEASKTTDDSFLKKILVDNLNEELGMDEGMDPHPELWLRFAEGLGKSREDVLSSKTHPMVEEAIQTFTTLCKQDTTSGIAALYAYESQQPEVSSTKRKGLCDFYGIEDEATVSYFQVHEIADIQHREEEREALAYCLSKGAEPQTILDSANKALDAHWKLLDCVCHEIGLEC